MFTTRGKGPLKALILAGGFGTRLRPLSCTRPKILFPIVNKPLLDLTLERLSKSGVSEVILAVNYGAEALKKHCGSSKYGMKILYSEDRIQHDSKNIFSPPRPLGTGGPIKKAENLLGKDESFLVLNGDILTDLDYRALMQSHKKSSGIATIALFTVKDPSRYGVVKFNEESFQITQFFEKPSRNEAPSNLINAGIYALNPKIFNYIPKAKPCSIEREVFPKLASEKTLFGHPFQGLWIDVGKREDYLKANMLILESQKEQSPQNQMFGAHIKTRKPIAIGENASIGEGSMIGPYVVLGKNVNVGMNVSIQNSVVFPGVIISDLVSIKGTVIGENVFIGKHVQIGENCIIGDGAVIEDNVTLVNGVTVCPFKTVSESVFEARCLM